MEKEFRERVQVHLKELDDKIEKSIQSLKDFEYPDEVTHLDFEVFSYNFTDGSPIRVFFLDKNDTEFFNYVNGKAEYPSPINPNLLDIDFIYPLSLEKEFENKIENYDPWKLATEEFIKWFTDKWNLTKSKNFKLQATIGHHDSWKKFDLVALNWVDNRPW